MKVHGQTGEIGGLDRAMNPYSPRRLLWLSLGILCLALGTVGLFLPLLPTTSFMLVAAFAFARSSPRLHQWLISHNIFGPLIHDWHAHRALSLKAKWVSLISMIAIVLLSVYFKVPLWVLAVQVVVLFCVSVFLWTRPTPPESG